MAGVVLMQFIPAHISLFQYDYTDFRASASMKLPHKSYPELLFIAAYLAANGKDICRSVKEGYFSYIQVKL